MKSAEHEDLNALQAAAIKEGIVIYEEWGQIFACSIKDYQAKKQQETPVKDKP